MNSVSFNAPPSALPRFAGNHERSTPYSYGGNSAQHNFDYVQDRYESQPQGDSAMWRATKKTGAFFGILGAIAAITSPLWAPILGVGIACNKNGPDGAIAKVKPVAGWGPAVADGLCPSVFVMPNGDLMSNDPPSWESFTNKVGHVYKNGLVTGLNEVDGAYKSGNFFSADLIRGLQSAQIAASDPENFTITVTEGAAPVKTVDDNGIVKNSQKKLGFNQKEGSIKLMGPYKGKELKDLPKDTQDMLKAAAAAHSYTGATS